MGKYPVYAIMALVFVGIIKLLQVTAFDHEKYGENKKKSFSNYSDNAESVYQKAPEKIKKTLKINASQENATGDPDSLKNKVINNEEVATTENEFTSSEFGSSVNNSEDTSENAWSNETKTNYITFDDLKNLYLAPIIAGLPQGQLREDVVIRYYRHEQDGDKVYSLKNLGYYIHEKEATETVGLGSNVLYYGDDVNVEDIRIVAYQLLETGMSIKAIAPSQFKWKANSIEIGTDTLLLNNRDISELYIGGFEKN